MSTTRLSKLSYIARVVTGSTPPTNNQDNFSSDGIEWIKPDNLMGLNGVSTAKQRVSGHAAKGMTVIPAGSVLVNCIGDVGKFGVVDRSVVTNQQINAVIFDKDKVTPSYGKYLIASTKSEMEAQSNKVVVAILNKHSQSTITYSIPPLSQQIKYATLLDNKTRTIDKMMATKRHLRTQLSELRQAIITNAVLGRGGATMNLQDTNIPWIGKIPAHWQVRRIKALSRIKRGASPRPIDDPKYFDDNGEYSWVRIADVTRQNKYLKDAPQKLSTLGASLSVSLEPGELFLSIAATVGKPMINSIRCCIHDGFIYFENPKIDREYLFYIFEAGEAYKGLGKLGTQLNLNSDTVGNIHIPLPPPNEQLEIVRRLNKKLELFDKTVSKLEESILLLEEYRSSLISNVVGGKVTI